MNLKNIQDTVLSFGKSVILFLFLLGSIFLISCGGISIGFMTLGVGLIISIPGALWMINKILVIVFGKKYMWRFLLEMTLIIILIILPLYYLFSEVLFQNISLLERRRMGDIVVIIPIIIFLFGAYRFHVIYQKSQEGKVILNEKEDKKRITEMESILKNIDTSKLGKGVDFITKSGIKSSYEEENVVKIAKYIVDTLGKNTFEGEELNTTFLHLQKYLPQAVSDFERAVIINQISHFVKEGGTVEFYS